MFMHKYYTAPRRSPELLRAREIPLHLWFCWQEILVHSWDPKIDSVTEYIVNEFQEQNHVIVIHVVALSKPARKETPPTDQPPQHDAKHHPRRHQTTTRTKAPKTKWLMRHDTHDTSRQTRPKQQQKWLMRHGDTLRNHDDNMMIFVVWRNHGGKRHRELKHERKLGPTHHLKSRWDRVLEQGRTETVPTIRMED